MALFFLLAAALAAPPSQHQRYLTWAERLEQTEHPEPGYRFLSDMHSEIAEVVREKPGVVTPVRIGHTVQKRPIWGFKIRDPIRPPKKKILVFAGLHALEWVGVEAVVEYILALAGHPVEGVEATAIPVVNVDRRRLVEEELLNGVRKYRRSNHNGVDLNRDYAIHREAKAIWSPLMPARFATSPAPLSQPESRAIDRIAAREGYSAAVSLHCFGGYIYYPWAGRYERPEDWQELDAIGRKMKAAQPGRHPYRVKQLSHWMFLFRAQGSEIDHLYHTYGIPSFLLEMSRSGIVPGKPRTWRDPFRMYNPSDPTHHARMGADALMALTRHLGEDQ